MQSASQALNALAAEPATRREQAEALLRMKQRALLETQAGSSVGSDTGSSVGSSVDLRIDHPTDTESQLNG